MSRRSLVALLVCLVALALAGCPTTSTTPHRLTIEDVRRRAAELPNDPDARSALAEGELLMDDGDPARALSAIDSALELAPQSARLHLLRAIERDLHGASSEALDDTLAALELASRGTEPNAPAIAEVAASMIGDYDDVAPDYAARVTARIAPLHGQPGAIGPAARHTIGELLHDLALRTGDIDGARAIRTAQGCVPRWRVAGPFGPRALLGFDGTLPPEEPGPLAASYDLGAGRGARDTREVEGRSCAVLLGNGPVGGAGSTFAEAEVQVPEGGSYVVRLETPNAAELFVDDRSVATIDRRREAIGRTTFHQVALDAGTHRVMVQVTSRHPNPVLVLDIVRTDGLPVSAGATAMGGEWADVDVDPSTPFGLWLATTRRLSRADYVAARELLGPVGDPDHGAPAMLVLRAAVTLSDPLVAQETSLDEARALLAAAAERDENAWYPALQLARMEMDGGRPHEAIAAMRAARARWPEVLTIALSLVDMLEAQGWSAESEQLVHALRESHPFACRPRRAELGIAVGRGRAREAGELAEGLVACDARSDARLSHLIRQRRWDEAGAELARLERFEPATADYQRLDARLTLARARGDDAEVERLLAELAPLAPQSEALVMMQADRRMARERDTATGARLASDHIGAAIQREPEALGDLRMIQRALTGAGPLEAYRRDGAEIIRAFESSGHQYEAPQVLVFDYTVTRVFEDGSVMDLTHQILRVQSEEALDDVGQFSPPEGADLLTIRTVKADGTRLEPDRIAGIDHIELPNLAIGDYVEYEFIRTHSPSATFPHGVLGDRFYFQSFEVPFDTSSLTLIVPESMRPLIDPRGDAPRTEERVEDGLRVISWTVHESRPLVQEPNSVSSREYVASINWGVAASWDMYVESLLDALSDKSPRDPAAERLVASIVGTEPSTPEQRAQRIYQWVLETMENTSDVFGVAPVMIASRTGNRARVLEYMLDLAGIPADLALVRDFTADATQSELADDDTYGRILVRMQGTHGPIWLSPALRGLGFGIVPPTQRGQDALMLVPLDASGHAVRATVTEAPLETDLHGIEVEAWLESDGRARFSVTEVFHGFAAAEWRGNLEEIPADQLEDVFRQQYVARILPGARMSRITISGREDAQMPLTIAYEFDVSSLGREVRGQRVLPPLFPTPLASSLARLASRTVTQLVGGTALDTVVRVHLPAGTEPPHLPDAQSGEGPNGARFSTASSMEGEVVRLERHIRVPRMRVSPAEYARIAEFARASDEAQAGELHIDR